MTSDGVPTFGVEEELLLVDADGGAPIMQNRAVADRSLQLGLTLQLELTPCQIETATSVLETATALTEALKRSRAIAQRAASDVGGAILAAGVPPVLPAHAPVTDTGRYRRISAEYGIIAFEQGVCGAHVHVAVPDRRTAIAVGNHLRPWLPVLLALTANSALYGGRDTGYASWRSVLWSRWPSAGPPPFIESLAHYDNLIDQLFDIGAILDDGMVYWDIRPSKTFPTLEVRVSDVPATVAETVLLAVLVRALVMVALRDIENGVPAPSTPEHALRWWYWRAARDGVSGRLVDPATGRLTPATAAVRALIDHVSTALDESGDRQIVERAVRRNTVEGNGSDRQRRAVKQTGSISEAVAMLTEQGPNR